MAMYFNAPVDAQEAAGKVAALMDSAETFEGVIVAHVGNKFLCENPLGRSDRDESIQSLALFRMKPFWQGFDVRHIGDDYIDTLHDAVDAMGEELGTEFHNIRAQIIDRGGKTEHHFFWVGFDQAETRRAFLARAQFKDIVI